MNKQNNVKDKREERTNDKFNHRVGQWPIRLLTQVSAKMVRRVKLKEQQWPTVIVAICCGPAISGKAKKKI